MGKRGPQARPLVERFWEQVDKRPTENGCWIWNGTLNPNGYGQIFVGPLQGKAKTAHRVSWEIAHGPIPPGRGYHGTCVLHRCDNPACVNPDHLFLGSHFDNMADMKLKGRANGGPGELTVALPFVLSFRDRHGKPRHYFRCKHFRVPLRSPTGSREFFEEYQAAFARWTETRT
jgi:hypothetical protein